MKIILIIFFLSASVYLLGLSAGIIRDFISSIAHFSGSEEATVEVAEETPVKQRYDVDAFYRRMRDLEETMDKDGLYDYEFVPASENDSGVEVITKEYEVRRDSHARR